MFVPAIRAIGAKPHLVHVALLDVVVRVLIGAVGLAALAEVPEEAADGHAGLVELVQEPARVALHAEPAQPVPAHRLAVAPAAAAAAVHARTIAASAATHARVRGGRHGAPDRRGGVEAALEVEAQAAVAVFHGGIRVWDLSPIVGEGERGRLWRKSKLKLFWDFSIHLASQLQLLHCLL